MLRNPMEVNRNLTSNENDAILNDTNERCNCNCSDLEEHNCDIRLAPDVTKYYNNIEEEDE